MEVRSACIWKLDIEFWKFLQSTGKPNNSLELGN